MSVFPYLLQENYFSQNQKSTCNVRTFETKFMWWFMAVCLVLNKSRIWADIISFYFQDQEMKPEIVFLSKSQFESCFQMKFCKKKTLWPSKLSQDLIGREQTIKINYNLRLERWRAFEIMKQLLQQLMVLLVLWLLSFQVALPKWMCNCCNLSADKEFHLIGLTRTCKRRMH